ncbi:hypothetical protein EOD40_04745 [Flavobacterium sufflavum]|uniref:Lipoprotein n=1 Tax=Flavobacterium sufflavum TaxID=1921138 RepID=A0A437L0P4_9FLAO|nr:hypothetical protein [Flavobacterium sufflavum]RVT78546.1 hypothetical protein EOD40_04745 [Flavobacterium sufflavum]
MRKILLLFFALIVLSCSKTNCDEEMARLEELRTQGWHNCNGSKACWDKINSDYNKKVNELDCD